MTSGPEPPGLAAVRDVSARTSQAAECVERYLRPTPRVRLGVQLGKNRAARACIDLSDGLADGLHRLADASGVGVVVDADRLPLTAATREWFASRGQDAIAESLSGGDDYELLFSAPSNRRRTVAAAARLAGRTTVTRIGHATRELDRVLVRDGTARPLPTGYEHFRQPEPASKPSL